MTAADAELLAAIWRRSPRMVGRRIGDEYILVPLVRQGAELDSIFNLNRVGTFVWERLDGQVDGHTLVGALQQRFEVERARAEADYCEFVRKLLSIGAIGEALE